MQLKPELSSILRAFKYSSFDIGSQPLILKCRSGHQKPNRMLPPVSLRHAYGSNHSTHTHVLFRGSSRTVKSSSPPFLCFHLEALDAICLSPCFGESWKNPTRISIGLIPTTSRRLQLTCNIAIYTIHNERSPTMFKTNPSISYVTVSFGDIKLAS